ncbi:MAG: prolipoprotein diacylglyceryl transferase [bacterium]|nr:prolipoprotein diacylglyceryl transferase [bacterium]
MFPDLLSIGPLTIHTYGLMVALGILAGVALAEYLYRGAGGDPGRMVDISFIVVLSGLLGARALFVAVSWRYFAANPLEIIMLWKGGLVFYGGLLGGIVGLFACIRIYGLKTGLMLDIGATAIALGHAMGRLGCFSAGCCYGKAADLPWSITFTDPRCLATEVLNQPVHPTQLYSSAFLFALTGFLVWQHHRKRFEGQIASLYLLLYGLFRLTVEYFRGDPRGSLSFAGLTLSTSQWISVVMVVVGAGTYALLHRGRSMEKPRQ